MQKSHALTFMGLLTLACRQPDRQSPVEPPARATASEHAAGSRATAEERRADNGTCVVPMSEPPLPQASPAAHCPAAPDAVGELEKGQITFDNAPSRPTIQVELARTDATRQRGLMYRTQLASEAGMLFAWDDESPRAFWMHNTCIPLDMLFVSKNGLIVGVLEQVPVLNDEPRRIPCPAAYVLEVNAGWVRGHQVRPGQHLTLSMP